MSFNPIRKTSVTISTVLAATALLAGSANAAPKRVVALTPFTANTAVAMGVKPVGIGQVLGGGDRIGLVQGCDLQSRRSGGGT